MKLKKKDMYVICLPFIPSFPLLASVGGPRVLCSFSFTVSLCLSQLILPFLLLLLIPSSIAPFLPDLFLFTPLYLRSGQSVSDPLTLTEQFVEMPDDFMSLCL